MMDRRQFIRAGSAVSAASMLAVTAGCAAPGGRASGKVVVVGVATLAPRQPSTSGNGPEAASP